MKGGNAFKMRGRKLSLTLVAIFFTSVLLWSWEKNPFTTLLSAQNQFVISSPEVIVDIPSIPSETIDSKEHNEEEESQLVEPEDTRDENTGQVFDAVAKDDIITLPSEREDIELESSLEKNVCNYAKGRWVADNRRPLYSGFECKQWLSEMWACRLTQRPDFSYEGYRWQPENCNMLEFERASFLRRMQDKTIAFVGDSLGRQQFQSMMCMATGGKEYTDIEDVGTEYGLSKPRGAIRPDGWAFRFPNTNTTILYYWSASLCDLEPLDPTNPTSEVAMHLDRPPAFLRRFLHRFDVLLLNTGHHWNRGKLNGNRWVMYVNGIPNTDRKLAQIGNAKNFTIHSVVKWVDSQLPRHPHLKAFFRTISPRHFANGDWNTGGSCDNLKPLASGSEVMQDGSCDPSVENAVKSTKVKILDITALSQLRDEGHISHFNSHGTKGVHDCLHWCLPGIPDTWNELLCAQIPTKPLFHQLCWHGSGVLQVTAYGDFRQFAELASAVQPKDLRITKLRI